MDQLATEEAKRRVTEAVAAFEKRTCAELVVMMRPASGSYRAADLACGAIFAFVALCIFLYHPLEFDFTYFPLEQAGAFAVGVLLCASVPPVRRLFGSAKVRRANVVRAAKAAFVDRGVSKTRGRTGVLVYLSSFERDAEVVLDVGLDASGMGAELRGACDRVRVAARVSSVAALLDALGALGECLAKAHPCAEDDVDELPNEVAA